MGLFSTCCEQDELNIEYPTEYPTEYSVVKGRES